MDAVAPPTPAVVERLLAGVIDPELGSDIVELGMVKGIEVSTGGQITVTIGLTTAGCPLKAQIDHDITARLASAPGVAEVVIDWTELDADEKSRAMSIARKNIQDQAPETAIPGTCRVVAIASGKGGVGKSSVAVNLSAAIAARGYTVGLLDADIGGFSVPRMVGIDERLEASEDKRIIPVTRTVGSGVLRVVSMGNLVEDDETALMWNGKTLNRAVQHFLEDVEWGDLDYLFIDMPPGTGDIQMSLGRLLPRTEVLIVTTPARTAQTVAARAVDIARKSHLRVAGVIENMSEFVTPDGQIFSLFGSGGGAALAQTAGLPLLASIPIEPAVAEGGDSGNPAALGEGPAAVAFAELADTIVTEAIPPIAMDGCSARLLAAVEAAFDD